MPASRHTLVYDGDCRLCRRSVALVHAWDRDGLVECVPFQDDSVPARFPVLTREACERAMQLVAPDGGVVEGAAAIERLLTLLPRGGALAWMLRLPLIGALADRAYRRVAKDRLRFGCGEHCGPGDDAAARR
jgi:predicted DCC family thiol-disulfide oxidoreductase YuxK